MPLATRARTLHLLAAALALAALATRWPLRSAALDELDSAHYALAVLRFSLVESRPHPPGYVFFVWAAQGAERLTGDPVAALTAVSALSGAVSIGLLFELLAPALGVIAAATACLATLAAPQVWLQQTRPMQDAFAFLWLLLLALVLVAASRRLTPVSWAAGCALIGAVGGAKQILPLFAAGLIAWFGLQGWRRGGWRWLVGGAAAATAGALTWIVPLSLNCGSLRVYLAHAAAQVAWQRRNEAPAFQPRASALVEQVAAALGNTAQPLWLGAAVWVLAAAGALIVWRRGDARWLIWLLAPLLLVRVLLVGPWPRFTIYWLPLVIALAACAADAAAGRLGARARAAGMAAAVAAFAASQAAHVLPTLTALHEGPAPAESALRAVRARGPSADTLVIGSGGVLGRHVAYYAERLGLRSLEEAGEPRPAARIFQVVPGSAPARSSWAWGAELVGRWSLAVPNAAELGAPLEVWNVAAVELRGPEVALRHWRMDAAGRRFATEGSRIVVFRPPAEEFRIRVLGRPRGPVSFSIGGAPIAQWDGRGAEFNLHLAATTGPRLAIDVRARCDVPPDCFAVERVEALPARSR